MNNPIRIGIIGLGRAGWGMHTSELERRKDKFAYVAACDIIEDRLAAFRERYADCKTYNSINDIIHDEKVELIVIATRSVDHYKHAMAALKAGKDVFVEKPMSCTAEDAFALIEQSGKPGCGRLFVRHNRRFEPDFIYVRKLIDSKILGDVFEIRLARNDFQRRDDWQTLSDFCGGQSLNWGPHIVDHALRLLDSKPKTISSQLLKEAAAGDCEDHVKMLFVGENGRIVDMEISGCVMLQVPEYLIYGTRGSAIVHQGKATLRYIDPKQVLPEIIADPSTPGQYFGSSGTFEDNSPIKWIDENIVIPQEPGMDVIWDHLYSAIRENVQFPISNADAAQVIRIIYEQKLSSEFPVKERCIICR